MSYSSKTIPIELFLLVPDGGRIGSTKTELFVVSLPAKASVVQALDISDVGGSGGGGDGASSVSGMCAFKFVGPFYIT